MQISWPQEELVDKALQADPETSLPSLSFLPLQEKLQHETCSKRYFVHTACFQHLISHGRVHPWLQGFLLCTRPCLLTHLSHVHYYPPLTSTDWGVPPKVESLPSQAGGVQILHGSCQVLCVALDFKPPEEASTFSGPI